MFKKNEGITLVSLTVTIIVIIILLAVTIRGASYMLVDSRLKSCITNMILVQAKAQTIFEKADFDENSVHENNLGTHVVIPKTEEDKTITPNIEQLIDKYKIDEEAKEYWYQWTQETLKANNIDPKILPSVVDSYFINSQTGEVIYSRGFKDNKGNPHYTLSDMLRLQ